MTAHFGMGRAGPFSLGNNNYGDAGAQALAAALPVCPALSVLRYESKGRRPALTLASHDT